MELKNKSQRIGMVDSTLSKNQYNLVLAGTLFWGFFMNFLFTAFFQNVFLEMSPWVLIIGYLVLGIIGVKIALSDNPVSSFIGYNLVAIPSGAVLAVALADYGAYTITKALLIVAVVTIIMFIVSVIFPEEFLGIGSFLGIALVAGLILEIITLLFGFSSTFFDWVFVLVFSGYIGYDFAVAQAYDKTIDNAIDSALDLYLDIINLFLRILSVTSDD